MFALAIIQLSIAAIRFAPILVRGAGAAGRIVQTGKTSETLVRGARGAQEAQAALGRIQTYQNAAKSLLRAGRQTVAEEARFEGLLFLAGAARDLALRRITGTDDPRGVAEWAVKQRATTGDSWAVYAVAGLQHAKTAEALLRRGQEYIRKPGEVKRQIIQAKGKAEEIFRKFHRRVTSGRYPRGSSKQPEEISGGRSDTKGKLSRTGTGATDFQRQQYRRKLTYMRTLTRILKRTAPVDTGQLKRSIRFIRQVMKIRMVTYGRWVMPIDGKYRGRRWLRRVIQDHPPPIGVVFNPLLDISYQRPFKAVSRRAFSRRGRRDTAVGKIGARYPRVSGYRRRKDGIYVISNRGF